MLYILISSSDAWDEFFLLLDWNLHFYVTVCRSECRLGLASTNSTISIGFNSATDLSVALSDIRENCTVYGVTYVD